MRTVFINDDNYNAWHMKATGSEEGSGKRKRVSLGNINHYSFYSFMLTIIILLFNLFVC